MAGWHQRSGRDDTRVAYYVHEADSPGTNHEHHRSQLRAVDAALISPVRLHVRPPQSTPAHRKTLRELVRAGCENKPGTYRMLSANGTVVYVGQSRKLRTRLLSYFRAKGSRNKAARILRHAFQIEWEYAPTEFGALLNELRLIKLHRPHFNRMMVTDDWPRGYIAITGGAVPGIRVVAQSDYPNAVAMYGPFRKVFALREAAQVLATLTGVRDCSIDDHERGNSARVLWFASDTTQTTVDGARSNKRMVAESPHVADSRVTNSRVAGSRVAGSRVAASRVAASRIAGSRVAGCLRHDLGTCAAPCIGRGNSVDYSAAVAMARAFLDGATTEPLDKARAAMNDAANNLEFERAASLRDRIQQLAWLQLRLQQFHANVDRLTFRYHALAPDGSEYVYLVRRGTVRAERIVPKDNESTREWNDQMQRVFFETDPRGADIPLHDLDEFHLVASWFRRRPSEKARTFAP